MRAAGILLFAFASSLGCDDCDDTLPSGGAPSGTLPAPSLSEAPAPRAIATPASFDLVATGSGALLVWGAPADAGGSVSLVALDSLGGERSAVRKLFERRAGVDTSAVEIVAASGGGRVAIAWVSRAGDAHTVLATHGGEGAEAFAPPIDLGVTTIDARAAARGALAAAAGEDGNVAIIHRQMPGECPPGGEAPASDSACVYFGVERLGGSPGGTERRGVGLAAPDPCARAVVGYVWTGGIWYYGICTEGSGTPVTTVYAIQFDPEYAHAERVLEGCEPIGAGASHRGVVVLGRCGDRIDAVELRDAARERVEVSGAARTVACSDGRPKITIRGGGASIERILGGPESGLEHLLPESIAGPVARAVWTGDALLVATAADGRVTLRRHRCEGDVLAEAPSAAGMMAP